MASPVQALEKALYAALSTDAGILAVTTTNVVYNSVAPDGSGLPVVLFTLQLGREDNHSPKRTRTVQVTVKGVSDVLSEALAIDDAADTLLHEQTLSITGWTNVRTYRIQDFRFEEVAEGGQLTYYRGGIYRFMIDAT